MTKDRQKNILVISETIELAEMAQQAAGDFCEITYASGRAEALEKVSTLRPDLVLLGYLGDGTAMRLCRELREGWISRHSSLLLIEPETGGDHRIMDDGCVETVLGEHPASGPGGTVIKKEQFLTELKSRIASKLAARENRLKASVRDTARFCTIWEQIPGLGAFELRQEAVIQNAHKAALSGKICAISVTDNPGGNPAIATEILSSEIRKLGVEPLVHVAFRDRSRNQCESLLYQLAAMDINNVLVLTGDYPTNVSYEGTSRPVFDLDSVNGLRLIGKMNRGMEHEIMRRVTTLAPTDFFCGVAFSPFKRDEAEVMGQYFKLKKKIDSGAGFIITQVGYDARKLDELKMWLKTRRYEIPVVASVYILSYATAKAMHDNRVPGCVVTDKLLAQIKAESEAPDHGRAAQLERAAKLYSVARGLGCAGASISGQNLPFENVEYVINRGTELAQNWRDYLPEFDYPQENGFYFFEKDAGGGLNSDMPSVRPQKPSRPGIFYFSRFVHTVVFEPSSPVFKIMRKFSGWLDKRTTRKNMFTLFEFWNKAVLYNCLNCGDCALYDTAYLCPVSQCPKNQRNAPCGGSFNGWCEVYPGKKKCVWVKAYLRLKSQGRENTITDNIVPPNDWSLWQTSSWLNYFLGRDYLSKRLLKKGK
jgi:methylenetetrahydrofolate reductase (NADPH)